jgi:phosphate transport system ATP-binding protein
MRDYSLYYGDFQALRKINIEICTNQITAIIGPSGCGKSTLLRSFNRMNDLIPSTRVEGQVLLDGHDIFNETDVVELRRHLGMVFQKPNPFPKSIFDNVAYGPRAHGVRNKTGLADIVERSLKAAVLWDDVKDELHKAAVHRPCTGRGA